MPDVERPWRCFVAVPIDAELRTVLQAVSSDLRRAPGSDGWRWTDAEAWHVTLAFLGATQPAAVPGLAAALERAAAAHGPFSLPSGGLGAFPSRSRARVLWYGVADADGRLRRLAEAVRGALGMEPEDRFRGHLTLARARARFGTDGTDLASVAVPASRLIVDRLVLYRSHQGRGPAHYEALATAELRGAA